MRIKKKKKKVGKKEKFVERDSWAERRKKRQDV